jgi:hypothetical protein
VYVSSISESHSFWKRVSMPGMLVAAAVRGLTVVVALIGSRSESSRGSLVTGHFPVLSMYFSTTDCSKTWPDFVETTGCSGATPLIAQNIPERWRQGSDCDAGQRGPARERPEKYSFVHVVALLDH